MADHRESIRAPHTDDRSGQEKPSRGDPSLGEPDDLGMFTLCGEVDGVLVRASWERVRGLECSPALLARAQVVVALGETFAGHHDGPRRAAALDGPGATVLLTLMRSCSTVLSVEVGDD